MAMVKFIESTKAKYNGLAVKDEGTLYYLSDTKEVYKGSTLYNGSVEVVDSLPTSGQAQGRIYFVTSTETGSVWTGTEWKAVISKTEVPLVNDLTTGGTDSALTAEQGKVLKGEVDEVSGKLSTHESKVATASASGHIKSGGDIEVDSNGLVEVKKIQGTAVTMTDGKFDSSLIPEDTSKANLASPTFTGTVTVPTPAKDTSATNKSYVDTAISSAFTANDAMVFKGTLGTDGTVKELPTTYNVGWTYRVATAGTYAGQVCEVGDILIAIVDRAGSGNVNSDWTVTQTNINVASMGFEQTSNKVNEVDLENTNSTQYPSTAGLKDYHDKNVAPIAEDLGTTKTKVGELETSNKSKLDKLEAGTADELMVSNADGTIKRSSKTVGGETLSETPNANTVATEAAVKTYVDNSLTWGDI